ncbi:DHS-like NAD/FAD-binding domain-containing protein [Microdochium bolleyi]|uniref:DHS-like NAD/FAD-binding domain-containing protein n=1 Tax=Microdochium bolleyi TaxID=196109 RepID=A0A136J9P3_9PEZI|nr:DHS-like NAD/FAD-binding domain-containing protein [Microdochium bolleyi]
MGQENSSLVGDETPPETLSDRTLAAVAKYIKDGKATNIVAMTGAGISTAAGIPDFRSPGTGLYNNLARLNLPHPEAVFEIDFFRENPAPFYVLARELYPGNFSPTIAHAFIALLARRNLLRMLFTQNIDCLERAAGVPGDIIVEAHGSFASQRCIDCKAPFPDKEMREHVELGDPPSCTQPGCEGLVKPDIVFFGEQLPSTFFDNRHVPAEADLVLVLGTSLSVQPFALLPGMAREGVPRVLFNMQRVGDLGTRADDVLCLDTCDAGVRKLAEHLGWITELEEMWTRIVGEKEAARQRTEKPTWAPPPESDDEDEDEGPIIRDDAIAKLVAGMEDKLGLTDDSDTAAGKEADDGGVAKQDHDEEPKSGQLPHAAVAQATESTTQTQAHGAGKDLQTGTPASAAPVGAPGSAQVGEAEDTDAVPQRHTAVSGAGGLDESSGNHRQGAEETSSPTETERKEAQPKLGATATYKPIVPEDGGGTGGGKPAL